MIRSAKHQGSNAYHRLVDLKNIHTLQEFEPFLFSGGEAKPILIITVDRGPDENPRYEKTINCAIAYVDSEANMDIIHQDEEWISKHVRQSQYCLEIIKCGDLVCCEPFRSSLLSVVENRFLPPPIPLAQTADGLLWAE